MAHPVMWFEVLGADGDGLRQFYGRPFGWTFDTNNPTKYGIVDTGDGPGFPAASVRRPTARDRGSPSTSRRPTSPRRSAAPNASAEMLTPRTVTPDVTMGLFEDPEGHDRPRRRAGGLANTWQNRGHASRRSAVPDHPASAPPRGATAAAQLAEWMGVSERTVYRDIRDLVIAGTPIDRREEIQALVLGARIVRQFADPALARASDSILNKVAAVIPPIWSVSGPVSYFSGVAPGHSRRGASCGTTSGISGPIAQPARRCSRSRSTKSRARA